MARLQYDEKGREIHTGQTLPPRPGDMRPPDLAAQIRALIRHELSRSADAEGLESFEEANDFEIEDEEPEVLTQYELADMAPESVQGAGEDNLPDEEDDSDARRETVPEGRPAVGGEGNPRNAGAVADSAGQAGDNDLEAGRDADDPGPPTRRGNGRPEGVGSSAEPRGTGGKRRKAAARP